MLTLIRRAAATFTAGILLGATAATATNAAMPPIAEAATTPQTIIGHRGAVVPGITENSLRAFTYAAQAGPGVVIEYDMHWTRDGVPIVMHDTTLDRTTTCTGAVNTWRAADIRARCRLDDGQTVPTAREAVAHILRLGRTTKPQIGPRITDTQARDLASFIPTTAHLQTVDLAGIDQMRRAGYRGKYAYVTWAKTLPTPAAVKAAGVHAFVPCAIPACQVATRTDIDRYQAAGLKVWLWTAVTDADHHRMADLGADGIVTDRPQRAAQLLAPTANLATDARIYPNAWRTFENLGGQSEGGSSGSVPCLKVRLLNTRTGAVTYRLLCADYPSVGGNPWTVTGMYVGGGWTVRIIGNPGEAGGTIIGATVGGAPKYFNHPGTCRSGTCLTWGTIGRTR